MYSSTIIITTQRLFLRPFSVQDASGFYNLNSDPEVIQYTGDKAFASVQEAKEFIKNYLANQDDGYGRWAVCLQHNKEFIGFCGLKYHPKEELTEVGFRFFKKFWNQGYATESAKACIQYAFNQLKLNKVYAHAHVKNWASQRVLKKCGLQFVKEMVYDGQSTKLYCIENKMVEPKTEG